MSHERVIIQDDAVKWLRRQKSLSNVLTGICDLDEIDMSLPNYLKFFKEICTLIFQRLEPKGYAIFIQTDRKKDRQWFDKSYMITSIAKDYGLKLVWHKIVLLREPDRVDTYRPGYSHALCYTKDGTSGAATPDVIPVSRRIYKNGTPILAAQRCLEFIKRYSYNNIVIDPFVGQGTIAALGEKMGLQVIGIDICPKQVALAKLCKAPA